MAHTCSKLLSLVSSVYCIVVKLRLYVLCCETSSVITPRLSRAATTADYYIATDHSDAYLIGPRSDRLS